jgi:hypothetical protein
MNLTVDCKYFMKLPQEKIKKSSIKSDEGISVSLIQTLINKKSGPPFSGPPFLPV